MTTPDAVRTDGVRASRPAAVHLDQLDAYPHMGRCAACDEPRVVYRVVLRGPGGEVRREWCRLCLAGARAVIALLAETGGEA